MSGWYLCRPVEKSWPVVSLNTTHWARETHWGCAHLRYESRVRELGNSLVYCVVSVLYLDWPFCAIGWNRINSP